MDLKLVAHSLDDLPFISKQVIAHAKDSPIWLFHGQMGAGKTSLIKQLCKELTVIENVSSPTFSLVNEYRMADSTPVYHFDFYRLDEEQEALDIGLYDYLDSGHYCFIEWPERISSLLDTQVTNVNIYIDLDSQARTIEVIK